MYLNIFYVFIFFSDAARYVCQPPPDSTTLERDISLKLYGWVPLHALMKGDSTYDVPAYIETVQLFLTYYPDAYSLVDADKNYPINIAASCGNNDGLVTLLNVNPDSASFLDGKNNLPLHVVCINSNKNSVGSGREFLMIEKLLDLNPSSASVKDHEGFYPLLRLMGRNHRSIRDYEKSIVLLINAFPEASKVQQFCEYELSGMIPLHVACIGQTKNGGTKLFSQPVIDALLAAYPSGVSALDERGRLPLHYAAENDAPNEIVTNLLQLYPQGGNVKDKKRELPVHRGIKLNVPCCDFTAWDVLYYLFYPCCFPCYNCNCGWKVA